MMPTEFPIAVFHRMNLRVHVRVARTVDLTGELWVASESDTGFS